jgi:hypothetical protein
VLDRPGLKGIHGILGLGTGWETYNRHKGYALKEKEYARWETQGSGCEAKEVNGQNGLAITKSAGFIILPENDRSIIRII